jgi:CRP-like cAMP-binding protein
MTDTTHAPPATAGDTQPDAETFDYAKAERHAAAARRRELANRVKELRRQADGAKERARKAQARFENAVAQLASEKPERPDWYEYPGALPRKTVAEASGLTPMAMSRVMERYRGKVAAKRNGAKRPVRKTARK